MLDVIDASDAPYRGMKKLRILMERLRFEGGGSRCTKCFDLFMIGKFLIFLSGGFDHNQRN